MLQRAKKEVPLDIVMNLLAAHSVPEGYTADEATEMIVKEMIPKVIEMKKEGKLDVELIDISCFNAHCHFLHRRHFARRTSTRSPRRRESCWRERRMDWESTSTRTS